MRIRILTTGGTIDKVYFDAKSEFQVGEPQIGEVLRQAHVELDYAIHALLRKDSLEMTDADRASIRHYIEQDDHERVLVTHGTDTMVETARALRGIPGKTIVLTGSLIPARFRENDALFNIGFAVAAVQLLPPGVYLAVNGEVHDPDRVIKDRARNRFVRV